MKTITIKIGKKSVMGVVEGLSTAIAQHNPEVDFETIWASDSEEAKLDIYYREAITDLENFLSQFSSSTTQQFDLQALADDFVITIKTLAYWPSRLSGVLTNQIQNYLVHAIMAGWLSDFPEMPHADYASMGASDLDVIKEILLKKEFSFAEDARHEDVRAKGKSSATDAYDRGVDGEDRMASVMDAEARISDAEKKKDARPSSYSRAEDDTMKYQGEAEMKARAEDSADKQQNETASESRTLDAEAKGTNGLDAGERTSDAEAKVKGDAEASARGDDNTEKEEGSLSTSARAEDSADKQQNETASESRTLDAEAKEKGDAEAQERAADGVVKEQSGINSAERQQDSTSKGTNTGGSQSRNKDNATQCFRQDWVDWGGGRPPYGLR